LRQDTLSDGVSGVGFPHVLIHQHADIIWSSGPPSDIARSEKESRNGPGKVGMHSRHCPLREGVAANDDLTGCMPHSLPHLLEINGWALLFFLFFFSYFAIVYLVFSCLSCLVFWKSMVGHLLEINGNLFAKSFLSCLSCLVFFLILPLFIKSAKPLQFFYSLS
jgi:hypothetical protein